MKKGILGIIVILFFWMGYSFFTLGSTIVPEQDFVITKGDTLYTLPQKLNLDVNAMIYKAWIKMYYSRFVLQAGSYHVNTAISLSSFFDTTLRQPLAKDLTITILPGWNIYDIDAYLARLGITKSGELIKVSEQSFPELQQRYTFLRVGSSLEGFLFPDTYRIRPDSTAKDIIVVLLDQFDREIAGKSLLKKNEFYQTLILASIVEREEKNSENKRVVAGILSKRLQEGIAIGADATVCYPYKLTQKECTPDFIGEHIYEKSDYNTRMMRGLPPTPISNVSKDTFDATENPQPSSYYYYLHDNDGVIHYAEDLAGHNANRVKYLGK